MTESDTEFEVELASTGQVFHIPPDKSILEVLEENNIAVDCLCTEGICGTCITEVLEGIPDHRDFVLDRIETVPHLTLHGLKDLLAERGVTVSHDTVWRFLRREGLSFKKNAAGD